VLNILPPFQWLSLWAQAERTTHLVESGSSDERGRRILLAALTILPRRSIGMAERTTYGRHRDEIGWEIAGRERRRVSVSSSMSSTKNLTISRPPGGNEHLGSITFHPTVHGECLQTYCTFGSRG
jgi:hypothetical protein